MLAPARSSGDRLPHRLPHSSGVAHVTPRSPHRIRHPSAKAPAAPCLAGPGLGDSREATLSTAGGPDIQGAIDLVRSTTDRRVFKELLATYERHYAARLFYVLLAAAPRNSRAIRRFRDMTFLELSEPPDERPSHEGGVPPEIVPVPNRWLSGRSPVAGLRRFRKLKPRPLHGSAESRRPSRP
jgi:hypothetical protein